MNSQPNHRGCWEFQWVFYRKCYPAWRKTSPNRAIAASEFVPVWDGEVKWPLKLSLVGWSHRDLHPTFGGWSLVTNWITLVDTFFKSLVWRLVPQPTLKHVMRKSSSSWIMETPKVWAKKTYVKTPPGFLFRTKDLSKNVPDFRFYAFCLKSIEGES